MKRTMIVLGFCFAVISTGFFEAPAVFANPDGLHKKLRCTECHVSKPVKGRPVDFLTGESTKLCALCHDQHNETAQFAATILAATASVKSHSSSAAIPETMKQQMIQWLSSHNYPPYGDPAVQWYLSCNSCHNMHGASYPSLLRYNMENGALCNFCHGGTINIASDWQQTAARRVIFGPTHLGLRQVDGTEVPAPLAPQDNDVVSGIVNFPLAVFTGDHRTTPDLAYRISIPGSVFNVRDINPANHLFWSYGTDMVTWDTRLEANKPYTVTITPYNPVTLVEGNYIRIYVLVKN